MRINGKPDGGGGGGVIASLSVTSNGTYTAGQGVDGYSPVSVEVEPDLQDKNVTENGEYTADQGYDGLGTVTVSVQPSLQDKNVTENGEYTADEGYYGLSTVTVSVPQTGYTQKEITEESYELYHLSNSASFVHRNVFEDDDNLQTVYLPNASYVGSEAFRYCNGLTRVELPVCESIYYYGFNGCSSLSYISIPKCKNIGEATFANCGSLSSVDLPECTFIGNSGFTNCTNMEYLNIPKIMSINTNTFSGCSKLSYVSLPSCMYILNNAFVGCSMLGSIELPYCLSISNNAFQNCPSLSIVSVGMEAYTVPKLGTTNFSNVVSIYVPSTLYEQYIVASNWSNYANRIISVEVPGDPLLTFSDGLLSGRTNYLLSDYVSVLSINKTDVISVSLSNCDYFWIGNPYGYDSPFTGCTNLKTVDLPGCTNVNSNMFRFLSNIETVNLPTCKVLSEGGFLTCSKLSSINIPECTYISSNVFKGCNELLNIDVPECSYIGNYAFSGCSKLSTVNIPKCEYIGDGVFYNCKLSKIELNKCSYIGDFAFQNCSNLKTYILGYDGIVSIYINPSISSPDSIYVPKSLVDEYKTATYWSQFANVIQPILSDFEFSDGLVYGWATSMDSTYLTTLGISANDVTAVSMSKLTSVASSTFMNHQNLVSVNIPLVSEYGDNLFNGCTSLSEYHINYYDGVITAGTGVFDNCPALNSIYVPYGMLSSYQTAPGWSEYSSILVEGLPELAFDNGLVYGITSNIDSTFSTTLGITKNQVISVNLPNVQTTGTSTFYSCQQLTTVSMNECTSLNSYCFAECVRLQTLSLPKCEYIGDRCFQGAFQNNTTGSHISLDLPVCSYIGLSAFYWTQRSLTLTLGYSGIVSLPNGSLTFNNTTVESIYVPASLVEDYKVANVWSVYATKIFPIPE